MKLGQVAAALNVNEKTADNAIRTLGLSRPLDESTVRVLGLALRAKHRYGVPLKRAYPLVREAMNRPYLRKNDALVRQVFTYLPEVNRGIRLALRHHRPLPRGPGWRDPYHPEVPAQYRRHPAVRRAIQWGLDLSLNESALWDSAEQRFQTWAEGIRAVDLLQGGSGKISPAAMWEGLIRAGIRFVAIGGAAGTLQGSARITNDLDICYDLAPDNTERLATVLNAWHARLYVSREPEARLPFVIDQRTFRDSPALSLVTDHGRLNLLPTVAGIGDYAACLLASEVKPAGAFRVRVLTLDALIRAKRAAGRRQDLERLIELEAIRAIRQTRDSSRQKPSPVRRRRRP